MARKPDRPEPDDRRGRGRQGRDQGGSTGKQGGASGRPGKAGPGPGSLPRGRPDHAGTPEGRRWGRPPGRGGDWYPTRGPGPVRGGDDRPGGRGTGRYPGRQGGLGFGPPSDGTDVPSSRPDTGRRPSNAGRPPADGRSRGRPAGRPGPERPPGEWSGPPRPPAWAGPRPGAGQRVIRPPDRPRDTGYPARSPGRPRDGATAPSSRGYGPPLVFRPAPAPAEPPGSPLAADLVRPGEEIVAGRRPDHLWFADDILGISPGWIDAFRRPRRGAWPPDSL